MRKDYSGHMIFYFSSMAYNWRQVSGIHRRKRSMVYMATRATFSIRSCCARMEVLERLTSVPSKLTGMGDQSAMVILVQAGS